MKEVFGSKKLFKQRAKHCAICKEDDYDVLDVHRWRTPGSEGGKYEIGNCICLCAKCHRLVHKNKIVIQGIFDSTMGKVVYFIDAGGKEHFETI